MECPHYLWGELFKHGFPDQSPRGPDSYIQFSSQSKSLIVLVKNSFVVFKILKSVASVR